MCLAVDREATADVRQPGLPQVVHLWKTSKVKLLVLSDLHLEGGASFQAPDIAFDATVLAGDIHSPGHKAVQWAMAAPRIGDGPMILVAGNHEFYGARELDEEVRQMNRTAEGSSVHVLNRRSVVIDGVRFLGCTFWTDFQLPVEVRGHHLVDVERALASANALMSDYEQICVQSPVLCTGRPRSVSRLLRAQDTLALHWVDRDWLRRELQIPFDGPTVVVTHHAPSAMSVAPQYVGDRLAPAFVSDLPAEFFDVPALWIHGHTHHSTDHTQRRCRVLSNPRGYQVRDSQFENESFNAAFVVEVATEASCHG